MAKNDISMRWRVNRAPRISRAEFLETLISHVESAEELPEDFDVDWIWRNTPRQRERHEPIIDAVTNSRSSFRTLMLRRLNRDLDRAQGVEVSDRERRRASGQKGWRTRRANAARKQREFAKRSAAAKKGWITRRKAL